MYCGPYALARYYQHFGDNIDSLRIAAEMRMTRTGVDIWKMAEHALDRGYAVTRYAGRKGVPQRQTAACLAKRGGESHLGVSIIRSFLSEQMNKGPFIVNVAAHEYMRQLAKTKSERNVRSPCMHYLFVESLNSDGYYECDDTYSLGCTILIPEDMMCRMLRAHNTGGTLLVLQKKNCT